MIFLLSNIIYRSQPKLVQLLPNTFLQVEIQTNKLESEPDSDVDITIRTQPNSYIALLAVDERVGFLRSGYDVAQEDVSEELRRYDGAVPSPFSDLERDPRSHFTWKPGGSNPGDMFRVSLFIRYIVVLRE